MSARAMAVVVGVAALLLAAGGAMAVSIETVHVGDPHNAGEWSGESYGGYGPDRICGAVDYEYNIGKYEVTAAQYCEFLNAIAGTDTHGLYNPHMADSTWELPDPVLGCNIQRSESPGSYTYTVAADWANRPVNYVSWADAARFANWLTNGQPTGAQDLTTTEDGLYYLNGATTNEELVAVTRKPGWGYATPTEDEWYKSAYYDINKPGGAGYWDYPTGSDSVPSHELVDPDPGNNANFFVNWWGDVTIGSPYWRTEVGDFENSESAYGTFDQGGNLWEWNETIVYGSSRGVRGGSFDGDDDDLHACCRTWGVPSYESRRFGFRVSEVPEPGSAVLLLCGAVAFVRRRAVK